MKKQILLVGAAFVTTFFSINAHDHCHFGHEKLIEYVAILLKQKAAMKEENRYLRAELKHELHKDHRANVLAHQIVELEKEMAHYHN